MESINPGVHMASIISIFGSIWPTIQALSSQGTTGWIAAGIGTIVLAIGGVLYWWYKNSIVEAQNQQTQQQQQASNPTADQTAQQAITQAQSQLPAAPPDTDKK
jgi:uncharacterized protein HemX